MWYVLWAAKISLIFACNCDVFALPCQVFIYNGAIKCNSVEFIFFYLIAVTLISTFMIFTPPVVGYICAKRPVVSKVFEISLMPRHLSYHVLIEVLFSQKFQQYADVLTEGLRPKHRWFGGWDIGRRFLFIVLGASIPPQYALVRNNYSCTKFNSVCAIALKFIIQNYSCICQLLQPPSW